MLKPDDIAAIFEWIELLLIASLKRNLARHKDEEEQEGFTWSAWQAEKLRSINTFRRQSRAIMDRYKDQIDDETRQLLEEQFEEGMNGAIQELEEAQPEKPAKQPEAQPQAEETTTAEPAPVPTEPPTVSEPPAEITVEAMPEPVTPEPVIPEAVVKTEPQFFGVDRTKMDKLIEDVTQLEEQVETAALRMTDDVYRQTVNRVQLAMASGAISYEKAVDMAVADFLAQGINCIEYRDGRRVNIADYVRMVLRTTSTRAALQGKSERWKAQGYDTVLVSAYGMCSKTCLPWQGRVYINDAFMDWSGDTRYEDGVKYGRSQYCGKWFPLLSSAIAEGLFHPNCRHSINLYIDGVTDLPEPMDNTDIERRYKEEQHQRALERDVRKAKRKVEGFMEPADIQKAKADLREAQKNVREYIAEINEKEGDTVLVRQPIQEKIYGGDVRIGSSADPYEPPRKPVQSTEGFTAEVNIPAPDNQTAEYTDQKIPERLKSAGADTDNSLSMGKSSDLGIFDSEPIQHTPDEYEEIVAYADERNVKIYDAKSFDGDMEMLKEQIDAISAVKDEFGITEKTTISFSSRIGEDLAITTKRGKAITFNKKALRNRELTDAYLASDNFFATNKSRGIALHEMGHVISYRLGEKGLDIARKTYYNIYGEEISSQEMLIWLRDNISIYSAHVPDDTAPRDFKPKNAKEVTPELLSLDRTNPNEFTNEFMRLLKEAYNL